MHLITLSFDDGFRKSNDKIARIYERFGVSACFNVIADNRMPADQWHQQDKSSADDFGLWNELHARGHEVMPHGLRHENYTTLPLGEAKASILRCLEIFTAKLDGFDATRAVFNFPYNASTPELEAWLPMVVRAFRTAGSNGINPLPQAGIVRLTCTGFGPGNCEAHLDACITDLLARPAGWLIYNTHGLDEEGWGPIGADYLERLLARLVTIPTVRLLPTGRALEEAR